MTRPQEVIEAIIDELDGASGIPSNVNFVGYDPNPDVEAIKLPIINLTLVGKDNLRVFNSDFIGLVDDGSGDKQRKYEMEYILDLDVQIWTAQGSQYSPRSIGNAVRTKLYEFTNHGPGQTLTHPNIGTLDDVWQFTIVDEGHEDDLTTTPTLRRWRLTLEVAASEVYVTDAATPITDFTETVEVL